MIPSVFGTIVGGADGCERILLHQPFKSLRRLPFHKRVPSLYDGSLIKNRQLKCRPLRLLHGFNKFFRCMRAADDIEC
jgi:hypothetical protein